MSRELTVHINRKFTRHDNPAIGSPNPDADHVLVLMVADGNDNGALVKGITLPDGTKVAQLTNIAQDEVGCDLVHLVASKGLGSDVYDADCCRAYVKVTDTAANVPTSLPGYTDKEEGVPWVWSELISQPTFASVEVDGITYAQSCWFINNSVWLKASEHSALIAAGVDLVHPNDLPQQEA